MDFRRAQLVAVERDLEQFVLGHEAGLVRDCHVAVERVDEFEEASERLLFLLKRHHLPPVSFDFSGRGAPLHLQLEPCGLHSYAREPVPVDYAPSGEQRLGHADSREIAVVHRAVVRADPEGLHDVLEIVAEIIVAEDILDAYFHQRVERPEAEAHGADSREIFGESLLLLVFGRLEVEGGADGGTVVLQGHLPTLPERQAELLPSGGEAYQDCGERRENCLSHSVTSFGRLSFLKICQ